MADMRLVTEEGEEMALLSSHSELQSSETEVNPEVPTLVMILCGVSKSGFDAFISLALLLLY